MTEQGRVLSEEIINNRMEVLHALNEDGLRRFVVDLIATIRDRDKEIERLRGELKEIRYRATLWPSPFANEVRNMIDALFLGRKWRKARPDLSDITEEEIVAARKEQDGERG